MSINLHNLHDEVAIKFNEEIHLGRQSVLKFIKNNGDLFLDFSLQPFNDSHMLYGYNSLGYPMKIGFLDGKIYKIIMTHPQKYNRYLLTISYDGKEYYGFQIQKDVKTVQGEISKVISSINNEDTLVQGASRTDTGVHAMNQKVHFDSLRDMSEAKWLMLLNRQLDKHIYIKKVEKVHPLFHSRYDVCKKRYVYKIATDKFNPLEVDYTWFVENVDFDILKGSMQEITGEHDFISFSKGDLKNTVRKIFHTEVIQKDNEIELVFEGNGFLRHMIRLIVFQMIELATSKSKLSIAEILKEKSREHTVHLAPAGGLYLMNVIY
jgi:tRNA pseudouridine38-40 synthase